MKVEPHANRAPWTEGLTRRAPFGASAMAQEADVALVGGGIAGVATAYFLLTRTDARVVLFEADRIANGASGHSAGQLVTYFERPLGALVEAFGFERAVTAQREVDGGWALLDELCTFADLRGAVHRFEGHLGMWSENHLLVHLASNRVRQRAGLATERCRVSDRAPIAAIERDYGDLIEVVSQDDVHELLGTSDARYRAVLSFEKGTANVVLLCERVLAALLDRYADRFEVAEETPVETIALSADHAVLRSSVMRVVARRVVLCTNGYRRFRIDNDHGGEPIDFAAQHELHGTVAYMGAYFVPEAMPSSAISYLASPRIGEGHAYFYVTRRPFQRNGTSGTLVAIGGPDRELAEWADYDPTIAIEPVVASEIEGFSRRVLGTDLRAGLDWTWHGLMGYTRGGVRLIGAEPRNPVLLYNLGCNGVGVLPSIAGGARIAQIVSGETPPPSAFDPD